ncbi:CFC_HP_G0020370.mRNA.1.CDS.1 [Saccharomyces cerevisiae]|nr:CFC_HP_G0101320.mRNA.1.CDS.1 [Saccharomyces cerevisiae]CAI5010109.1 CFC_HP_G0009610.mRNA.1.CDS.1 [Saccharomyces cerevisiae]CAI5022522.1 CFC_HP_G0020370.mRNA.1.CDS.1 [Saccharomyces cerevisiae]CAI6899094.1 CFC_HP_G0101320.mRNA.1.CDS.1 [Saccharomyces cerevisiae]CAI6926761.1 CFC_HP_G0009610.mRNA.1.CDS.1 [Saccharomyces cerevisiae]
MNRQSGVNAGVQNNPPSRVVYLGSIPYDQTEEQILDLCSNVGPVINLKMMFDPQTGRSKGYAFIEFRDLESSASAVRNLNGYQLGSRFLKCGYSSNSDISGVSQQQQQQYNNINGTNNNNGNNNNNSNGPDFQNSGNANFLSQKFPELPSGIDVNINMTTPAMMISSELAKKPKEVQLKFLQKFQEWTRAHPEDAVSLLELCPQLSFVTAELLLTNGICKVDDLIPLASRPQEEASATNNNSVNEVVDPAVLNKQKELLKQVLQLNDSQISILPDDERMAIWDLKQKALRGEFGAF